MPSALVSIITPTYNHEKYIGECIKSAQNQTYSNWEMIVVNDGSTDNTLSVVQSFAAKDNRIHILSQENIGIFRLSETYNLALKHSRGKYIAILEGDDVWEPYKLELQVNALENNPNIVMSWGRAFESSIDLTKNYRRCPDMKYNESLFFNSPVKAALKELIFSNYIPALTVLVRRTTLENIGGFLQSHNLPLVDLPTWQQLSLLGEFAYIDQSLGRWRISPNQVTKTHTIKMIYGVYQLALDLLKENDGFFKSVKISETRIHSHFKGRLIVNYCHSGNFKLKRKDFSGAKQDFFKALSSYGFKKVTWKIRAIWGILKTLISAF